MCRACQHDLAVLSALHCCEGLAYPFMPGIKLGGFFTGSRGREQRIAIVVVVVVVREADVSEELEEGGAACEQFLGSSEAEVDGKFEGGRR